MTFSNIASCTDSNGHKVYVQRAYVNAGGKKVAVYRGITKGYNGKMVIINGQMTTKKPDIKKLSALSYKQGQYKEAKHQHPTLPQPVNTTHQLPRVSGNWKITTH